ncbi:hypothetical protein EHE19_002730 [Ruminiclostridium herbifermentans]|uniref:Uncharacterized protein n=1 Tax=Ruminiclostridium herbifermentans TaxID=2488810 RepID=A0A4U7JFD2_9FIRM|nr:hypothetical protein [Ruminiclostridium herbifermentans]QNU67462.1 hypothetical protein EHE19_002730 [Ruminiclostridium herbifermentans]
MITGVNSKPIANQNVCAKKQEKTKEISSDTSKDTAVVLELGKSSENTAGVYGKPATSVKPTSEDKIEKKTTAANAEEIERLWAEANRATQNLRDLVEQLLKSQGKKFHDVFSGKDSLEIDEETRAAAQQAISEDGECGVQAVSDRIVAFAKAISNNDPEKYEELMKAIDKGFAQAEKALGGQLPEICRKTYDEVKRKMDEWKSGGDVNNTAENV